MTSRGVVAIDVLPSDPAKAVCNVCGDFVTWCPVWLRRWPELERLRDA